MNTFSDDASGGGDADRKNSCMHCGGVLQFAARINRRTDHPAYRIYRCEACSSVEWVEQAPGKRT